MNKELYIAKLLKDFTDTERKKFVDTPFVCHHTREESVPYLQYLVIDFRLTEGYDYFVARFRALEDAIEYAESIK